MDQINEKILACLVENARYSLDEISKIVDEKKEEVEKRIKELENNGTILKYGAVVNRVQDDKHVSALIEVKVTPQAMYGFDKIAEDLCKFNEIKDMYLMSGGFDLALFIEAKNLYEVSAFVSEKLSQIEGIVNVSTHFVLKNYKVDGAIACKASDIERQMLI